MIALCVSRSAVTHARPRGRVVHSQGVMTIAQPTKAARGLQSHPEGDRFRGVWR